MQTEDSSKTPACERCHRRKSRCDKARPACTPCRKANTPCLYDWRDPAVRKTDMEKLERRLRQSEAKNSILSGQLSDLRQSIASGIHQDPASENTADASSPTARDLARATHGSGYFQVNQASRASFLPIPASGDEQFLGSASGLLLAELLQVEVSAENTSETATASPTARRFVREYHGESNTNNPDISALPSRDLSRSLMSAYLSHDYLSYPCLHPQALIRAFDTAYVNEDFYRTNVFEAFSIDMVLAIGTARVSKFDWQGLPDSETHHDRAMSRFGLVLSLGGTDALQAILLTCQYRMLSASRDSSTSLWHLVGSAARICLELGLHRESVYRHVQGPITDPHKATEQVSELNRRCFWCVVAMDRLVSITLGRPLAIHIDDIDTELPRALGENVVVGDSPLRSMDGSDGDRLWQSIATFVLIVRYRIICGKILTRLHNTTRRGARSDHDDNNIHAIRHNLAAELEEWRQGIDALPLCDSDSTAASLNDQERSCLESRDWYNLLYHNAVLMLFRPSQTSHDLPLDAHGLRSIFESARQSIRSYSALHRSRRVNYSWITLHAVFIAGLSYVYAVRMHFQTRRQQLSAPAHGHSHNHLRSERSAACLAVDPTIPEIVADTRACSIVLVAVSERWSSAWNRHLVFGRLSDAVLADAVDFLTQSVGANALARTVAQNQDFNSGNSNSNSNSNSNGTRGHFESTPGPPRNNVSNAVLSAPPAQEVVPDSYRYCFDDLPQFEQDYLGTMAIDLASQDWLLEIQGLNGLP